MTDRPDIREQLAAFLAGELDAADAAALQARIDSEAWVARQADEMADLLVRLADVDRVDPPEGFSARLRAGLAAEIGHELPPAPARAQDDTIPLAGGVAVAGVSDAGVGTGTMAGTGTGGSAAGAGLVGGRAPGGATGPRGRGDARRPGGVGGARRRGAAGGGLASRARIALGVAAALAVLAISVSIVPFGSSDSADSALDDGVVAEATRQLEAEEGAAESAAAPEVQADALAEAVPEESASSLQADTADTADTADDADGSSGAGPGGTTGDGGSAAAPATGSGAGSQDGTAASPAGGGGTGAADPQGGDEPVATGSGAGGTDPQGGDEEVATGPGPDGGDGGGDAGTADGQGGAAAEESQALVAPDEPPAEEAAADETAADEASDTGPTSASPGEAAGPLVTDLGDRSDAAAAEELGRVPEVTGLLGRPAADGPALRPGYRDEILRAPAFADGTEPGACLQQVLQAAGDGAVPGAAARHAVDGAIRLDYALVRSAGGVELDTVDVWIVDAGTCSVVAVLSP